ncbi:MAG: type VII toxin-antitoxin system HepT family RNase toxin [Myxococcota bacterium]
MTDERLVAKKLARIETCLRELETLVAPEEITVDVRAERFTERTLQIAIQAAQDIASHIVSDQRLGEPATNRELFDLLSRSGWLDSTMAETMGRMIGFRNILVHGYEEVRPDIVRDVVEHRLGDFRRFVAMVRERV